MIQPRSPHDDLPRGARAEDYDRKGIDDTLAMLDDPEGCALVDLFGAAVQEDGSTWLNDHGHYVAALFGITATSPTRRRLHDVWQTTAHTVAAAQDEAA